MPTHTSFATRFFGRYQNTGSGDGARAIEYL